MNATAKVWHPIEKARRIAENLTRAEDAAGAWSYVLHPHDSRPLAAIQVLDEERKPLGWL